MVGLKSQSVLERVFAMILACLGIRETGELVRVEVH